MILYVEDELVINIDRIIRLFRGILSREIIRRLEALNVDAYGAKPEEIKKIVEASKVIEIEYSFPAALNKVVREADKYSLFLIDRNLTSQGIYNLEDVQLILPEFSKTLYDRYFEREGDFILHHLFANNSIDCSQQVYFLTANTDDLRNANDFIEVGIAFGQFSAENIIEKGVKEEMERLKEIINNSDDLKNRIRNKQYVSVLSKIDNDAVNSYLKIAKRINTCADPVELNEMLGNMRKIQEAILEYINKNLLQNAFSGRIRDSIFYLRDEAIAPVNTQFAKINEILLLDDERISKLQELFSKKLEEGLDKWRESDGKGEMPLLKIFRKELQGFIVQSAFLDNLGLDEDFFQDLKIKDIYRRSRTSEVKRSETVRMNLHILNRLFSGLKIEFSTCLDDADFHIALTIWGSCSEYGSHQIGRAHV